MELRFLQNQQPGSLHILRLQTFPLPLLSQALIDLYFFKEANPGVDIDTMLSSASTTFKNFIMRGLYKVRCCYHKLMSEAAGKERVLQREGPTDSDT